MRINILLIPLIGVKELQLSRELQLLRELLPLLFNSIGIWCVIKGLEVQILEQRFCLFVDVLFLKESTNTFPWYSFRVYR